MRKKSSSQYRIVVVGEGGVGKSSLTMRYIFNKFQNNYDPTIEDFYRKQTVLPSGDHIMAEIYDTAGIEELSSLRDIHIKNGDGFLIVFSLKSSTVDSINEKFDDIIKVKQYNLNERLPIIIVGNKCDLVSSNQKIYKRALNFAKERNIECIFTSAKENLNCRETFEKILYLVHKKNVLERSGKLSKKKICQLI